MEQALTDQVKLQTELRSFRGLWSGGFFKADPYDPLAPYWLETMAGHFHVIYLACIKPWIGPDTCVLEIGPGRGAWTRLFLGAAHVTCVDALSAEHNGFYDYVGTAENLDYHQVEDFTLSMIANGTIDYVFSYDVLCHVSFAGISEYARSLYRVMKPGAHGFVMVADYRKFNAFVDTLGQRSALNVMLRPWRLGRIRPFGAWLVRRYAIREAHRLSLHRMSLHEDDQPSPGRWYDAGTDATCDLLRSVGFTVLDEDMGVDPRSPLIHFQR